jgi:hypothetical protein
VFFALFHGSVAQARRCFPDAFHDRQHWLSRGLCRAIIIHTSQSSPNAIGKSDAASPAGIGRFPMASKGLAMNARFLRDEAARFRGMADDADREATKLRLLAMAVDYEDRARVANELTGPDPGEAISEFVGPTQDEARKIKPGRKIALGLKETVLVERRPVGRPRGE